MNRRRFILQLGYFAVFGATAAALYFFPREKQVDIYLRPPGALAEKAFLSACIRCGNCSSVCPMNSISTHPYAAGAKLAGVPFINPRIRACNLCMKCTNICPTGALKNIPDDKKIIATSVSMGMAIVDEKLCISHLGRLCGICRDACPYPGKAIKLKPWARPEIIEQSCVGCGLCVMICPQQPAAILIDPSKKRVLT